MASRQARNSVAWFFFRHCGQFSLIFSESTVSYFISVNGQTNSEICQKRHLSFKFEKLSKKYKISKIWPKTGKMSEICSYMHEYFQNMCNHYAFITEILYQDLFVRVVSISACWFLDKHEGPGFESQQNHGSSEKFVEDPIAT